MNSKKNTIFGKFVFTLNSIVCLFLFSCYIINNFYLDILSDYSLISVFYPQFFILNLLFLIYWILKFDFRFILSLVFLFISISNPTATLETGAVVNVPLFINEGDKIKVDTVKGSYKERYKE